MRVPNPLDAIGGVRELAAKLERIARGTDALPKIESGIAQVADDASVLPELQREIESVARATTAMERETASIAQTVPALVDLQQSLPALVPVLKELSELIDRMLYWEEMCGKTLRWEHISDDSAFNQYRAKDGSFDAFDVEELSRKYVKQRNLPGRFVIRMKPAPKGKGSIASRTQATAASVTSSR